MVVPYTAADMVAACSPIGIEAVITTAVEAGAVIADLTFRAGPHTFVEGAALGEATALFGSFDVNAPPALGDLVEVANVARTLFIRLDLVRPWGLSCYLG